eukprot:7652643-Lingulodinium_polyedra.AAC.1
MLRFPALVLHLSAFLRAPGRVGSTRRVLVRLGFITLAGFRALLGLVLGLAPGSSAEGGPGPRPPGMRD